MQIGLGDDGIEKGKMKTASKWFGIGGLGSLLALVVLVVALSAGAQASSGFTSCGNKTLNVTVESGPGEKQTFPVKVKAVSVQGTTCAAAFEFVRYAYSGEKIGKSGYPQNYHCKPAEFKAPLGYIPTLCTKGGKKIKYAGQGG